MPQPGNGSAHVMFAKPLTIRVRCSPATSTRWPTAKPSSDRKSTRLNSSHVNISYAVFCLKKKHLNRHLPPLHTPLTADRSAFVVLVLLRQADGLRDLSAAVRPLHPPLLARWCRAFSL